MLMHANPGSAKAATDPRSIAALPSTEWQIESEQGDKVTLSEKQGCLQIDYDVEIRDVRQSGHEGFKQTSFRVLRKEARPLDEGEERILFEARGMAIDVPANAAGATILPIILDETGERLFYSPFPYPHLKNASKNWARWMSSDLYSSEAGGATQSVFDARGGDGNNWPDGKLRFAGFEVRVRRGEFGREQGTLQIGSIETGGLRLTPEDPFAYADSLLHADGDYTLAVQVRDHFQGPPIREFSSKIHYQSDDLQSCRQRITVPLGAAGDYWIDYEISDRAGQAVAGDHLRYEQAQSNPSTPAPEAVALTTAPALGIMRINPEQHMDGVYDRGESATVTVRLFAKSANDVKLTWRLRPFAYDTTFAEAAQTVRFDGKPFVDVDLTIPWQDDHDAYRLDLSAEQEGKIVDRQQYVLGRRTDLTQPRTTRKGKLVDRDLIKQSAYFHLTYVEPERPKGEDATLADFIAFMDQASQVSRHLTYMVALEKFLVLPGVYDMSLLDRLMDAAADRGCTLKIRFCVEYEPGKGDGFTYLRYSRQSNMDGSPILQAIYGGGFSLTDPDYIAGWMDAFKAVHDRYKLHPAFEGYYVMQPCGENTIFDKPWEGQIAGYEASTEPAFRDYLRNTLKLSLDQLNTRWQSKYPDWNQVEAPLPDLRSGTKPDLRRQWLDFNLFKVQLGEWWFRYAASHIREYDKRHLLVTYGGAGDAHPEALSEWVDYFHNGGNHFLQGEGRLVKAWEKKTGWITEPHHPFFWAAYGDPREDKTTVGAGWMLDWSVYIAFAQAGGGGANLHVYYAPTLPKPLPAHYGGIAAYDRLEKFKPILRELHGATLLETPRQVATLQDPYTLYCKHRTTFAPRLEDLRRWLELVRSDSVPAEELRDDHLGQYRLLVPNLLDEVMSQKNIETLRKTVEGGAKMIISAKTGSYCPDLGAEPFQLLSALNIQHPVGPYVMNEAGVDAGLVGDNALFEKGRKIRFYSQADMRQDLADPKVQKTFWTWPYRWLPQSDYFGYFKDNRETNGKVLARFASGAVAVSVHAVGRGEVLVFWGTPDMRPESLAGLMSRAADWAGVENPRRGSPIANLLEARNADLGRYYALMYQIHPGSYRMKLPQAPDGKWFVDDMVDGFKFGLYTGAELREQGIDLGFVKGASPLKILRLVPDGQLTPPWNDFYRKPAPAATQTSATPQAAPVHTSAVTSFERQDAKAEIAGDQVAVSRVNP